MLCGQCFSEIAGADVCPVCGFDCAGQQEKYPMALRPGVILNGRYIVGRVLGQGGFGITYLDQDDRTRARVAIKEYYPAEFVVRGNDAVTVQILSGNRAENFTYGKEQFLSEARTLAEVRGNAHIVQIFSYFEENSTAYFVMEYVGGMALDAVLRQRGRLSPQEADELLLPLMDALAWVHEKGIVHRDIAPDNIIVTKGGTAKLIDFGAARYSTGEKSKSLDVILKHGFAPKEQYTRRGRQGPWTDVYALAATYYYAVTGKVPPDAIDRMEQDDLIAPTTLGVKMEADAEEALLKGLALNAQDRWQSMADFAAAMRASGLRKAEAAKAKWQEQDRRGKEAAEKKERAEQARREKEARKSAKAGKKRSVPSVILVSIVVLVMIVIGIVGLSGKSLSAPTATQTHATDSVMDQTSASGQPAAPMHSLVLGTSTDYFPFEFMYPDDSGELVYGGIDVSVAQYIADYTGKELKVENMGFDSLLPSLQKGDFDIVIAAIEVSEERLNIADFSNPYYTDYPPMVLVKATNAGAYTSLESFAGKLVGAQAATSKERIVTDDMPGANLVSLQDINDMINQLINDKIDAAVLDGAIALQYIESNRELTIASVELGVAYPYCVAVAKGDPKGLLPGINMAIADMLEKGKVNDFVMTAEALVDIAQEISGE